jgi:hypothetical protein
VRALALKWCSIEHAPMRSQTGVCLGKHASRCEYDEVRLVADVFAALIHPKYVLLKKMQDEGNSWSPSGNSLFKNIIDNLFYDF